MPLQLFFHGSMAQAHSPFPRFNPHREGDIPSPYSTIHPSRGLLGLEAKAVFLASTFCPRSWGQNVGLGFDHFGLKSFNISRIWHAIKRNSLTVNFSMPWIMTKVKHYTWNKTMSFSIKQMYPESANGIKISFGTIPRQTKSSTSTKNTRTVRRWWPSSIFCIWLIRTDNQLSIFRSTKNGRLLAVRFHRLLQRQSKAFCSSQWSVR